MNEITICIPTFKRSAELAECFENLLSFSSQDFEVIVGNDCSPDSTDEVVLAYANRFKYFKYINHKKNIGFARNMDSIIRNSTRSFIFVLNDDDFAIEEGLINCTNILKFNSNIVAVGARYVATHNPNSDLKINYSEAVVTIYGKGAGAVHLIENLNLCDCHPVMRRSVFENGCHYYDRTGMLIPIYFDLLKRGDVAFIDKPIYQHRATTVSLTTRMSESWFLDMANADLELCFSDLDFEIPKERLAHYRTKLLSLIYFQAARMAMLQGYYYIFWLFIKRFVSLGNINNDFLKRIDREFLLKITVERIAQIINDSNFKEVQLMPNMHEIDNFVSVVNSKLEFAVLTNSTGDNSDSLISLYQINEIDKVQKLPLIQIESLIQTFKTSNSDFELKVFNNTLTIEISDDSSTTAEEMEHSNNLFNQLCARYF